jgi:folate-binding protein YgfZ
MTKLAGLPRHVVEVAGEDRVPFLQGLVSNDVALAAQDQAVWAALLTPQGKYLADFFVLTDGERLLLDCAAVQARLVADRLSRYRLRSRVTLRAGLDWLVHAAWSGTADLPPGCVAAPDPRLPGAGIRILSQSPLETNADADAYDRHRLALGLPEGCHDLDPDRSVLLEAGFDELHGVSWTKGCYMGQELTARTKYRGLIKRRLLPVETQGTLPPPGTAIEADGREVGTLRHGQGNRAMATLRLDALSAALTAAGQRVRVIRPDWAVLPESAPDH